MAKKTYVLDTSVYLTDFNSIYSYGTNDIVIPFKVLDEIDKHKKRQDGVGSNARHTIRVLDELRSKGNLHKGVRLKKGAGLVFTKRYDPKLIPPDWDNSPDNKIIATALTEMREAPNRKTVVVSRDINMRVKCDAIGLPCEDYITGQVVKDVVSLYTGFSECLVDDQFIEQYYSGEPVSLDAEEKLYPNQYVMLVSSSNPKKTALARHVEQELPLQKIREIKQPIWGVRPRNKEQAFAMDLLLDPKIPIVSLIGKAGSGKTLCALAAGLAQVMEDSEQTYKRLVVSRPVMPMGRDLGFLPGTLEEKMAPWLAPVQDNLQFLMGDKATLELYMEKGMIDIEALTYIRGRSISNAFVIIDEAQNLTRHELKTIVTRVGENTKIVLTGDIEQIDNVYIDETSNGLTYAVERMKEHNIAGHVTLRRGERSAVATLAAKIL
jgi:PhoH-like ATPase